MKSKWDADTEWQLIDIWVDHLEEYSSKMTMRRKEAIVTTWINIYLKKSSAGQISTPKRTFVTRLIQL